ncbi:uncharacterized protein SCHCODRAFT_01345208 [Schizophyllum commune H4-8]|uniref:uncharacterized protein n=1 Tax=Schizophyllum commune (strain H4-8 / FGSC 9210) TaxID=578458 RepID=UPI00215FDF8D|nr:uncharacterized protein SCHCODRAFT_01345208 [Schizophyllum commune H4-8]KAI5900308.1 hypothetical protein SCHCODRAFT_01345208 [Schizophyllum commune H4-8]
MRSMDHVLSYARTIASIPLHRTAYVPSEEEAANIKEMADELRSIDVQIGEQISSLSERRAAVREQIALNNALLSPCRRLPSEALSMIFLLAVPDDWEQAYAGQRSPNFARVCRLWRNVAFDTPRLWSRLRLEAWIRWPSVGEASLLALEEDVERTAQVPLDVDVQMGSLVHRHPMPYASWDNFWGENDAWLLLRTLSHRWKRASFYNLPLSGYANLATCSFPALQTLAIHFAKYSHAIWRLDADTRQTMILPNFQNAPNVTNLHIDVVPPMVTFELPRQWSITDLTINYAGGLDVAFESLLRAMMACSATVRSCHISVEYDVNRSINRPEPIPQESTIFPCLEDIHFEDDAILLCYFIAAPHAINLRLSGYSYYNQFDALETMLDRSQACQSLNTLSLAQLRLIDEGSLLRCLRRLPSLREVALAHDEYAENICDPLITLDLVRALDISDVPYASEVLLPNLSRLVLTLGGWVRLWGDWQQDERSFQDALLSALRSRAEPLKLDGMPIQSLQSFVLDDSPCWPPCRDTIVRTFQRRRAMVIKQVSTDSETESD